MPRVLGAGTRTTTLGRGRSVVGHGRWTRRHAPPRPRGWKRQALPTGHGGTRRSAVPRLVGRLNQPRRAVPDEQRRRILRPFRSLVAVLALSISPRFSSTLALFGHDPLLADRPRPKRLSSANGRRTPTNRCCCVRSDRLSSNAPPRPTTSPQAARLGPLPPAGARGQAFLVRDGSLGLVVADGSHTLGPLTPGQVQWPGVALHLPQRHRQRVAPARRSKLLCPFDPPADLFALRLPMRGRDRKLVPAILPTVRPIFPVRPGPRGPAIRVKSTSLTAVARYILSPWG